MAHLLPLTVDCRSECLRRVVTDGRDAPRRPHSAVARWERQIDAEVKRREDAKRHQQSLEWCQQRSSQMLLHKPTRQPTRAEACAGVLQKPTGLFIVQTVDGSSSKVSDRVPALTTRYSGSELSPVRVQSTATCVSDNLPMFELPTKTTLARPSSAPSIQIPRSPTASLARQLSYQATTKPSPVTAPSTKSLTKKQMPVYSIPRQLPCTSCHGRHRRLPQTPSTGTPSSSMHPQAVAVAIINEPVSLDRYSDPAKVTVLWTAANPKELHVALSSRGADLHRSRHTYARHRYAGP